MNVLIRADASTAIGSGHVMRCLTLANVLQGEGATVSFACRRLPGDLLAMVAAQGWPVFALPCALQGAAPADIQALLPWQADIDALAEQLPAQARFDWIIVDHYGLDHHWERAAQRWAPRIAAIDDLANRAHAVDLLLDQNYIASAQGYGPLLTRPCQLLLGPRYALLREEFQVPARPVRAEVERVLVNFGGMDTTGQTLKACQALADFSELQVTVVAGMANPRWAQLQALAAQRPSWQLLSHSRAFGQLMAAADLFVGAGGGTSWERAALGLPTICLAVAANQEANAQALAAAGMHCYLGPCATVSTQALAAAIGALLQRFDLRRGYAERSRQLVDGGGARRVAEALLLVDGAGE